MRICFVCGSQKLCQHREYQLLTDAERRSSTTYSHDISPAENSNALPVSELRAIYDEHSRLMWKIPNAKAVDVCEKKPISSERSFLQQNSHNRAVDGKPLKIQMLR